MVKWGVGEIVFGLPFRLSDLIAFGLLAQNRKWEILSLEEIFGFGHYLNT